MSGRELGEDAAKELTGKVVMWGPAIAGAILLGPAGVALGFTASVGIVASLSRCSPPGGDPGIRGRNMPSN
jgi:hypothetical protein